MAALQLAVDERVVRQLLAYVDELARWNEAYNLTAVRLPRDMVTRHVLDSLAIVPHARGSLIDVGTGAGLPGIPLAILQPARRVTLVDANGKRIRFLHAVVRRLALENVTVEQARVENWQPVVAEGVSVVSRAFARLADFLRVTAHLGGADARWLAMKGKLDPQELAEIPESFRVVDTLALTVPSLNEARHLVVVRRRDSRVSA